MSAAAESPMKPLAFDAVAPEEMAARARDFLDEIRRRRSVRHFSSSPVPLEVLEDCIAAAASAPSGANKQPWTFVLVTDPEVKQKIRVAAEKEEQSFYHGRAPKRWLTDLKPFGTDWHKPFLTRCPWLLAVFAAQYGHGASGIARHYYVQESVGMAVGLLLGALHHSGLATLTHTPNPMGFLRDILDRPDNERPYVLIALGYPEPDCRVPALERKPLSEILTEE